MTASPPQMSRIALAGWSLHRRFRRSVSPLTLLDFPQIAREEFGIAQIELNSPFFSYEASHDPAASPVAAGWLDGLRSAAEQAQVRIVGVAVDHHGDLASADEQTRRTAVAQHAKWIQVCEHLGSSYFRANSGAKGVGPVTDEHEAACATSFAELAERAAQYNVSVLMENHWGLSADPERMVRVLRSVDNDYCGALADFRNWPETVDPHQALSMIAPFARVVHAKFLTFNEHGNDPDFDTPRALDILQRVGFAGPYAIEFEGQLDDHEGVVRSERLLRRLLKD
ncbi:MAG: TIM barrel protein [Phycisphaerales bacterium]|nr:MAG: TIM barrel protein [Phycisphaerales bacterium]